MRDPARRSTPDPIAPLVGAVMAELHALYIEHQAAERAKRERRQERRRARRRARR